MPEGVEVRLLAEGIGRAIIGSRLIAIKVLSGRYMREPIKGYLQVRKQLPLEVANVGVKGKFIWWEFNGTSSKKLYLLSTLGMTGAWTMLETLYNRVEFTFSCGGKIFKLYLFDIRNFATLKFADGAQYLEKLNRLGIDMFSRLWTANKFIADLSPYSDKTIADAILSQKVVAGPGTYIIAESLYCAKIPPAAKVKKLNSADITLIYDCIRKVAKESYLANKNVINIHKLTNDIKVENKFKFKIYGRKFDSKGNPVKSYKVSTGRSIKWVPAVQKMLK